MEGKDATHLQGVLRRFRSVWANCLRGREFSGSLRTGEVSVRRKCDGVSLPARRRVAGEQRGS